jgi:hypothetical protein
VVLDLDVSVRQPLYLVVDTNAAFGLARKAILHGGGDVRSSTRQSGSDACSNVLVQICNDSYDLPHSYAQHLVYRPTSCLVPSRRGSTALRWQEDLDRHLEHPLVKRKHRTHQSLPRLRHREWNDRRGPRPDERVGLALRRVVDMKAVFRPDNAACFRDGDGTDVGALGSFHHLARLVASTLHGHLDARGFVEDHLNASCPGCLIMPRVSSAGMLESLGFVVIVAVGKECDAPDHEYAQGVVRLGRKVGVVWWS